MPLVSSRRAGAFARGGHAVSAGEGGPVVLKAFEISDGPPDSLSISGVAHRERGKLKGKSDQCGSSRWDRFRRLVGVLGVSGAAWRADAARPNCTASSSLASLES